MNKFYLIDEDRYERLIRQSSTKEALLDEKTSNADQPPKDTLQKTSESRIIAETIKPEEKEEAKAEKDCDSEEISKTKPVSDIPKNRRKRKLSLAEKWMIYE